MKHVPTLDLRRYDTDREAFVREVGQAYEEFGFCCFTGHGVDPALVQQAYEVCREFFQSDRAVKMKTFVQGKAGTRGYTPFKIETAKTSKLADLKEFYHVGRDVSENFNPYPDILEPNVWPEGEMGERFRATLLELYAQLEGLGRRVLKPLALNIGLPENHFVDITQHGNSILRELHYPPVDPKDLPAVRAEAHEDISLITLLVGATQAGLEILTRDGKWLPITTTGDAIVVNVGDMMQRMTNHVYPSTTHRVVNPEGPEARKSRYSIPFFMDPNPDYLIQTIPSCITADNPNRYPEPITAHDYLMERLAEIKLTGDIKVDEDQA